MITTVNNAVYDEHFDQWRNEESFLNLLETVIQPVRFRYLLQCIDKHPFTNQPTVLDIGCGGGFMSESLHATGFKVTGIDQSQATLDYAIQRAEQKELGIDYRHAQAEAIPYPDQTFDLVIACDVLEHVNNLDTTIKEACRVLKPGGLLFFDTINRTLLSWIGMIEIAQNLSLTAFMPVDLHVWSRFIKPIELTAEIRKNKLMMMDLKGISPKINPLHMGLRLLLHNLRKAPYAELATIMKMKATSDLSIHYMGYAKKHSDG